MAAHETKLLACEMTIIWVKYSNYNAVKVSTKNCEHVADFIIACKKALPNLLGSYDSAQLSISTTEGGTPFQPQDPIPAQTKANTTWFISVAAQKEMVSMPYGKATMPFISDATGVEEETQVWENIPYDTTVEASPEFVELFKKNCSVFEFVAQFPEFMIICEYHMTMVNDVKKRRLNEKCDYSICHRGLRDRPHLVTIEAKSTNRETMLQCIRECASIHYSRKQAKMENCKVYGIHSTGSVWHFIFIDENGSLFVSKEYQLNPQNYVKEGFDLVYRLIYYVVKQSHVNSPRTTPAGASVSINQ